MIINNNIMFDGKFKYLFKDILNLLRLLNIIVSVLRIYWLIINWSLVESTIINSIIIVIMSKDLFE